MIPTLDELAVIGWAAGREVSRSTASPEFQKEFTRAVRDAVLEGVAKLAIGFHGTLITHGIPDMMGDITYDEGMLDGHMIAAFIEVLKGSPE